MRDAKAVTLPGDAAGAIIEVDRKKQSRRKL
jgi:hypothetical protein